MKKLITACVAILVLASNPQGQTNKTPDCPNVEIQELTVVCMRLEPSPESVSVFALGVVEYRMKDSEIELLRSARLKGILNFNSGGRFGEIAGCQATKHTRVILIGRNPIESPVALAQPDGVDVIYYQVGNEWKMIPSNAPVLKSNIILKPSKLHNATYYWVEHVLGLWQGGTAFIW